MKANLKNLLKFLICLCMCVLAGVFFAACSAIQSDYRYKGGGSSDSGSSSGGGSGGSGGGGSSDQGGSGGDVTPDTPTSGEITIRYDYGAASSFFGTLDEITLYETIKKDVGIVKLPTIKSQYSDAFLGWFNVSTDEKVKIGDKPQTDIDVCAKFDINKVTFAGLFENGKYVKTWDDIKKDYPDAFFGTAIMSNAGFSYFTNLKGDLVIGSDITAIQAYAFWDCEFLTGVVIPGSVINIGIEAFSFSSIENLKICEGKLTSIDVGVFSDCTNLKNVSLPNSIRNISGTSFVNSDNIEYNTYDNAYYLGNETNPYLVLMFETSQNITSCQIHPDTKIIANAAFFESSLKSVNIPSGVKAICNSAFESCPLEYVYYNAVDVEFCGATPFFNCSTTENSCVIEIGENVTRIPEGLCENFYGLRTVIFAGNSQCKIIDHDAFCGCRSLTSVTIPNSVTGIGSCAFYDCRSLTSITLPDSVTIIGEATFFDCISLTSINIPNSVTDIQWFAFYDCRSLTSVIFENPNGWVVISGLQEPREENISASDLSNASKAATCLYSHSAYDIWHRYN